MERKDEGKIQRKGEATDKERMRQRKHEGEGIEKGNMEKSQIDFEDKGGKQHGKQ